MRILNGLIALLCVLVGAFLSGDINKDSIIMSIVVFFCVIAGNMINDYFDIEIDKVNRPQRQKLLYRLGRKNFLMISLSLFFFSNTLSLFSGIFYFFITITATVILIIYTPFLKPYFFFGNLIISAISGFTFILGGLTAGRIESNIFPFLFAFFLHLPREILKDLEDIEGDKKEGLKTLPVVLGEEKTLIFSYILIAILFIITIFSLFYFNLYFKITMISLFHLPLIYFLINSRKKKDNRLKASYLEKSLKKLMLTGLIVLISGGIKC